MGPTPLWSLGAAWWSTPGVLWPCGAPHGRPRSAASGVVGRSCLGVAEEAALPFADCLALFQEQQRPSVRPECFLLVRLPRAWACGPGAEEEERNVHSCDHDPPAPRCILRRDRTRSHWCVAPRGSGAKRAPPCPAPRPGCGEQRQTWTVRAGRRGCTVTTSTNGIALRGRNRPGTRARGPR